MSDSDFLLELMERAFLLQQKRIWSLETLLKIERGQLLQRAPGLERQNLIDHLNSNLRIARECLNDVARTAGYESGAAKLIDPSVMMGVTGHPVTTTMERTLEQMDMAEREAGIHNLASMCRELGIQHEPFFEQVNERIRSDQEFYRACRDFELSNRPDVSVEGDSA